ncbi:hypothetical protein [Anoxybacillus gonensis]|uniref:Uncharacterized protein n=1 Tax=Anoxybacillus gonensis TaxID=198467 RepID=A0AAW7TGL4_9BACL|nr:hypothetical protein [Anoxybacillus gonensis]MDO0877973.1 hypothetical protein [Anoxybacillus gonensis]
MMELRGEMAMNRVQSLYSFSPLCSEGVYVGKVKKHLGNGEAIVTIQGQDVHVQFEGEVPKESTCFVRFVSESDGIWNVVCEKREGHITSHFLQDIEKIFSKQGKSLSLEEKLNLQRFFEMAEGTVKEKIKTIETMVSKKIPINTFQLQCIHEALKESSFDEQLNKLMKVIDPLVVQDDTIQSEQLTYGEISSFSIKEEWMPSVPSQMKEVIVKTVTEKMTEAERNFKEEKRNINTKIEKAIEIIKKEQNLQTRERGKHFIEAAVRALDRVISQGDLINLADMEMEKKLLQISAKLAEAKTEIINGRMDQALKCVQESKNMLQQIQFQPSQQKIVRISSNEKLNRHWTMEKQIFQQLKHMLSHPPKDDEVSARYVLEQFRQLGFYHEKDLVRSLLVEKDLVPAENLKTWLIKMTKNEGHPLFKTAEQALMNITGQQLLSKFQEESHTQTMFYQLPFLQGEEIKTVQIYLHSRNANGKVDWENCYLYFLLNTERYGKVSVSFQALQRQVTLTIRTEDDAVDQSLRSFINTTKENLETIGYRVRDIVIAKLEEPKEEVADPELKYTKNVERKREWRI